MFPKKYELVKRLLGKKIANKALSIYKYLNNKKIGELNKYFMRLNGIELEDVADYFDTYPKNNLVELFVNNLDDGGLKKYISEKVKGAVLFTGGGILKKEILSIPDVKFIHIHPGVVPDVRGADCFFWSYLLKGKAGYSVFYMNEGIDTGDILNKKEFLVDLDRNTLLPYSNDEIYQSILQCYDPCLRIKTLIELLDNKQVEAETSGNKLDLMNLVFENQNPDDGRMYFFMHKELRNFVINKLKKV